MSAALITALTNEINNRLLVLEADRANNLAFVGGGWVSNPIEFVKRSTEIYGAFLVVARDYQSALKAPVMVVPVASAMQALFTRFALLWKDLPASTDANPLHPDLRTRIADEVPKFVNLVT